MGHIAMPLVIPSVDIMDSREYIFTSQIPKGEEKNSRYIHNITVGKAVRASSSFPAIFSPCRVGKHAFMDGGMLDNIPVLEVRKQGAEKVLAVNFDSDPVREDSNIMDIIMKTLDIMGNKISEKSLKTSDYILTISTDKTGLLDTSKLDNCYRAGINSVHENIDLIKKALLKE